MFNWNETITIISKDATSRQTYRNCCWTQKIVQVVNNNEIINKNITVVRIPKQIPFRTGDFAFIGDIKEDLDIKGLLAKYNANRGKGAIKLDVVKDNNISLLNHTRVEGV